MYDQLKRKKGFQTLFTAITVLLSALLQVYVIQAFIRPSGLLSSGFTGIAILIERIAAMYGKNIPTALSMIVLNLPVALLCSKSISVRFTTFSMIQVFLCSFFLRIFHFTPMFDDLILNVIFGGALYGYSIVLAVKGNASTGGTDFIALFVSNKTGKSIWKFVFMGNVFVLCIFGMIFGWQYAGYSILFQFISTKVVEHSYTQYEQVTLQITTEHAKEIIAAYVAQYRHGISSIDVVGGYSSKKMQMMHTVISSYEVKDIVRLVKDVDPHVIINVMRTERFYGGFYRLPIDKIS